MQNGATCFKYITGVAFYKNNDGYGCTCAASPYPAIICGVPKCTLPSGAT